MTKTLTTTIEMIFLFVCIVMASCTSGEKKGGEKQVVVLNTKKILVRFEGKAFCGERQDRMAENFAVVKFGKVDLLYNDNVIGSTLTSNDGSYVFNETLISGADYQLRASAPCGDGSVKVLNIKKPIYIQNIFISN